MNLNKICKVIKGSIRERNFYTGMKLEKHDLYGTNDRRSDYSI
jgi:hypothetical protein